MTPAPSSEALIDALELPPDGVRDATCANGTWLGRKKIPTVLSPSHDVNDCLMGISSRLRTLVDCFRFRPGEDFLETRIAPQRIPFPALTQIHERDAGWSARPMSGRDRPGSNKKPS